YFPHQLFQLHSHHLLLGNFEITFSSKKFSHAKAAVSSPSTSTLISLNAHRTCSHFTFVFSPFTSPHFIANNLIHLPIREPNRSPSTTIPPCNSTTLGC